VVTPGVDAHVHRPVTTGTETRNSDCRSRPARLTRSPGLSAASPSLELVGAHCHIGSQISSLDVFETAARRLVAFVSGLGGLPELNLGGGPRRAVPAR